MNKVGSFIVLAVVGLAFNNAFANAIVTAKFKEIHSQKQNDQYGVAKIYGIVEVNDNSSIKTCSFEGLVNSGTKQKILDNTCDALTIYATSDWEAHATWSGYDVELSANHEGAVIARGEVSDIVVSVCDPKNK